MKTRKTVRKQFDSHHHHVVGKRPGKAILRLNGRIADWEQIAEGAKGSKEAYRKPGALK